MPHGNSALLIDNLNFDWLITNIDDPPAASPVTLAPNPACDQLTIELGAPCAVVLQVQLLDACGRTVLEHPLGAGQGRVTLPVEHLAPDLHVLRIMRPDGSGIHRSMMIAR